VTDESVTEWVRRVALDFGVPRLRALVVLDQAIGEGLTGDAARAHAERLLRERAGRRD
jgi:hypothetical protein